MEDRGCVLEDILSPNKQTSNLCVQHREIYLPFVNVIDELILNYKINLNIKINMEERFYLSACYDENSFLYLLHY